MIFEFLKMIIIPGLLIFFSYIGTYFLGQAFGQDEHYFLYLILYAQFVTLTIIYIVWKFFYRFFFNSLSDVQKLMEKIVYNRDPSERIIINSKYELKDFIELFNKLVAQYQNLQIDKEILEDIVTDKKTIDDK